MAQADDNAPAETQAQIEKDVWEPMFAASDVFDADGFLGVLSADMIRVSADRNEVYGAARYRAEIRDGFERAKARGLTRKSGYRFLTRASSGDLAYETGYFRSDALLASGERRIRYSRFEMLLRKEAGIWKILVDKDTADGGAITEAQYQAASGPVTSAR
ncbi:MAG: nuclear transport factor 2 family protein [Rhodospirillaceae bacterium]|nr:nuclear transport factor 2 family protein [Rhodospirillaceae bacterium]